LTQYTLGLTRRVGHGRAFSQVLLVAKPAVGLGFTYINEGRYWEYIDSVSFQIVTDANAGNRLVTLTVADGQGVALATVPSAAALTASKTGQYTYLDNYSATTGATDGPFLNTFPGVWLQPDYRVTVSIANVQVGDQVSNIRVYAERFVTGAQGYLLGVAEYDEPTVGERVLWRTVTG
jgi:hypothetical protein